MGRKLSKSQFSGVVNKACHLFTLGKQSEDLRLVIDELQVKINKYQAMLDRRRKLGEEVSNDKDG